MALLNTLDLNAITYLTIVLNDSKGYVIPEAGVHVSDMLAYRSGNITQQQFIGLTASKVEDRFAAFDAMEGAVIYDRNQARSLWEKTLSTNTDYLNDRIKANQVQWGCK